MRVRYALTSLLFALSCAEQIGARQALHARPGQRDVSTSTQDEHKSTATSHGDATSTGSSSSTEPASKTTDSGNAQTDAPAESAITTTGGGGGFPTATTSGMPKSGNSTAGHNALPIQPEINPALGIAGVILMIAGLGLGFVGIKHRQTQTFLSTSLLMALGIEVLIVYLMHPPVPVAVQGAFLIAGVAGGCGLGALALIFKEVSEGFGCFLGGFCFAMWLLVLAPGGLIENSAGKIILIAIFSVACFCLYISRFTRVYGLIFCTSFAGSTAFILGIDCFSKAGLKEFWLYIWNLNNNEFPLFTDTYPITRNMRVEIAAIVIVAFLGTMSQVKIWKIVREQKAKRDAERIRDEEARDALDAEIGRDVESRNRQSLANWEGTYDGKKGLDVKVNSLDGSTGEASSSQDRLSHYDLEGTPKSGGKRNSFPLLSLQRASGDFAQKTLANRRSTSSLHLLNNNRASFAPSLPSFGFEDDAQPAVGTPSSEPRSPGPSIVPSVKERRGSKMQRLSMISLRKKDAIDAADGTPGTPFVEEDLDDLASSIAATAAEPPDVDALSIRFSRPNSMFYSHAGGGSPALPKEEFIEDDDEEALHPLGKTISKDSSRRLSSAPPSPRLPGQQQDPEEAGSKTELKDRLPTRISKAAANYRTNEWAKEVSRAEPEPIQEVLEHADDAVQIDIGNAAEAARAEENNAAPAPPPPPPQPPAPVAPLKSAMKSRSSTQLARASSSGNLIPVYAHGENPSSESWSAPLAKRASSNPLSTAQPETPFADPPRNISAPISDQTIVESPVDATQPSFPPQPTPASRPSSLLPKQVNLLDERRERLERRLTSTSFMMPSDSTPAVGLSSLPEDSLEEGVLTGENSREGSQGGEQTSLSDRPRLDSVTEEEDMTLAERKALVQQQQQQQQAISPERPPTRLSRPPSQPVPVYSRAAGPVRMSSSGSHAAPAPIYDSHQPRAHASAYQPTKAAQNWSQWRSSTAVASTARSPILETDSQMDMLRAYRAQTESQVKRRESERKRVQERMDAHMRMGGMNDAHRAALRKMQEKAK